MLQCLKALIFSGGNFNMKNYKDLLVAKEPLYNEDSLFQTYGCRHTNPNICSNNSLSGICAFTSENNICKRPPRSWTNKFKKLKNIIIKDNEE
jgi:hypothetical protein